MVYINHSQSWGIYYYCFTHITIFHYLLLSFSSLLIVAVTNLAGDAMGRGLWPRMRGQAAPVTFSQEKLCFFLSQRIGNKPFMVRKFQLQHFSCCFPLIYGNGPAKKRWNLPIDADFTSQFMGLVFADFGQVWFSHENTLLRIIHVFLMNRMIRSSQMPGGPMGYRHFSPQVPPSPFHTWKNNE